MVDALWWGCRHVGIKRNVATVRDRTRDLQIFSLTLSQLSYCGYNSTIYLVNPLKISHNYTLDAHSNSHHPRHAYITTTIPLTDRRRALQQLPYASIQFFRLYFAFQVPSQRPHFNPRTQSKICPGRKWNHKQATHFILICKYASLSTTYGCCGHFKSKDGCDIELE